MNVVFITPGTGSFYCGSCLRDVALLQALRRRDVNAFCAPMYLPMVTEGETPEAPRILFGGINVYLQQKLPVFRRTPAWLDAWFDRPWLLKWATRGERMTDPHELGAITCSMLRGEAGRQRKEVEKLCVWLEGLSPRPDLVHLSNALLAGLAPALRRALGIPVVCTLQGEDSFLDSLPEPHRTAAWGLLRDRVRDVEVWIGVSRYYGELMQSRMEIPLDRLRIVWNGIDLDGFMPRKANINPPVIGYLARMIPEKGLGQLVEAYLRIRASGRLPGVRLHVAGAQTKADAKYVHGLRSRLSAAGAEDAVSFLPNVSRNEKLEFLKGLTVLSVPASYGESFGMYVAEAMACGVPVVQPADAAFPELINKTGGGRLIAPNDVDALVEGLVRLISDREENERLGALAREGAYRWLSVERTAEEMDRLFGEVLGGSAQPLGNDALLRLNAPAPR